MRDQILQVMGNVQESGAEENLIENYVERVAGHLSMTEMAAGESLSRMKHHFEDPDTEMVVLSGERYKAGETPEESKARNTRQTQMLQDHLDKNKFSYVKAKGGYIENYGQPDESAVHENSFIIINHPSSPNYRPEGILDHFKKIAGSNPITNEQGESTEQEAIVHKPTGSVMATMHNISGENAGSSFEVGSFKGDANGQYFTELAGKRRFELRESVVDPFIDHLKKVFKGD